MNLYLSLLKECLLDAIYGGDSIDLATGKVLQARTHEQIELGGFGDRAHTMLGRKRLNNIHELLDVIMEENIPGDLMECGIWRGGACIFMRGYLKAHGITDRKVYCADSFQGLPAPDGRYKEDEGDLHHTYKALSVSLDEVKQNFSKYDLLDDQVVFIPGWFKDLQVSPLGDGRGCISLLRLDGDMYGSTMDALEALYDIVSAGGYIIIDDYFLAPCRKAVHDFREKRNISSPIIKIDNEAVYWQKEKLEPKIVVCSAIFGGIDSPKEFPKQNVKCDYMQFNEQLSIGRTAEYFDFMGKLDNRMKAKYYKMMQHKFKTNYDIFIWVDGSFQIVSNEFVQFMAEAVKGYDIAISKHTERNNIYQEYVFISEEIKKGNDYFTKRYSLDNMRKQMNVYVNEGFNGEGLYNGFIFAVNRNQKMQNLFNDWWKEELKYPGTIDQLALPYLLHKYDAKINSLDLRDIGHKYFRAVPHLLNV